MVSSSMSGVLALCRVLSAVPFPLVVYTPSYINNQWRNAPYFGSQYSSNPLHWWPVEKYPFTLLVSVAPPTLVIIG